jgi:hypothetical protein
MSLLSALVLLISVFAAPVAVLGMSRHWWAASQLTGDPLVRGASVWVAIGLWVSSLGIWVGGLGLLFGILWCTLLQLAAMFEKRATAAGKGSPKWRRALVVALGLQGASALVLGGLLLAGFVSSFTGTIAVNGGPTGLYTWLFGQYGITLAAAGSSSVVAVRRLVGLSRGVAEPEGLADHSGAPN